MRRYGAKIAVCALLLFFFMAFFCPSASFSAGAPILDTPDNPFDETVRLLERWTVSHWGRDCFVWIVHYPENFAEPWVRAEALRSGMTESERIAYHEKFVSELKLGDKEPFLVSVYSFGARPISLAPVSENIALVTPSGKRVRPVRYETALDQPGIGVVQGLVFFPKQNEAGFAIAVKGMGVHDERIFSFTGNQMPDVLKAQEKKEPEPKPDDEVVVVKLPARKTPSDGKSSAKAPVKMPNKPKKEDTPPPPLPKVHPPAAPVQPEKQEVSEDVPVKEPVIKDEPSPDVAVKNSENSYVSREYVLKKFLDLWILNRPDEMYELLSTSSRKLFTKDNFAREARKSSDFRAALKNGYQIEWVGEERAKVISDQRFLFIRTLLTRTLGVIREGSSWKIVW